MTRPGYDPVKAHEYYEKHKHLTGRHTNPHIIIPEDASTKNAKGKRSHLSLKVEKERAVARVGRLKVKIDKLQGALSEANQALSEKRQKAVETKKQNSDGKSTAQQKQASQDYRDKNQAKIASDEKKTQSSSGGSSSSSSSSSKSVSDMNVDELVTRVNKITGLIKVAKQQLTTAEREAKTLAHSAFFATGVLSHRLVIHSDISRKESVKMEADFGGYATRSNIQCSDGRTILPDAFKANDGQIVPLVWQHGHNDVNNVLGHCKLENRPDGVYAHAYFNSTAQGQNAKMQVQHGDIKFLSIFANQLKEQAKRVMQGNIREVSLVLAGANPGAFIDNVSFAHSDGTVEVEDSEAYISSGSEIELVHAATATKESDTTTDSNKEDPSLQEILGTLNPEQQDAVYYLLSQALTDNNSGDVQHSDTDDGDQAGEDSEDGSDENPDDAFVDVVEEGSDENSEETVEGENSSDTSESSDTTDENDTEAGGDVQHDNTQEDNSMTHNVFDAANRTTAATRQQVTLSHDDIRGIVDDVMNNTGSLKRSVQSFLQHTGIDLDGSGELKHGIENIEYLFPDPKTIDNSPSIVGRRMEWVDKVLNAVRKQPYARIRTVHADITADEARARGYIKGNEKIEEFFTLIKRDTTPQTVYKKQKLDRDDVIDITTLDIVAFIKAEMQVMLSEELAGAILIGDGRSSGDEDKIKEDKIRPIVSDDELYVTTVTVNLADANSTVDEFIDAAITAREFYKGSGTPTLYTTQTFIGKFLTVKDSFGRRIYNSLDEIKTVLQVADIVPVDVMGRVPDVVAIMVNLADYSIGTDRGGQATMFDDFDLNFNKMLWLLETRVSGALTLPKSAVVFRSTAAGNVAATPVDPAFDGTTITVPTVTGVTYKRTDTNATMTTGAPVTLASGESLTVHAVPASGYYFPNNSDDTWTYTNES